MRAKLYKCDDCGCESEFNSYRQARAANWAVSKDYKHCYCPACAPAHRFGKATDKNGEPPQLPDGWEQLEFVNL